VLKIPLLRGGNEVDGVDFHLKVEKQRNTKLKKLNIKNKGKKIIL